MLMPRSLEVITVDVRGEVCPVPLTRAVEAMGSATEGQRVEVLTDFRPAVLVVTLAAMKAGWDVNISHVTSSEWNLGLGKSSNISDL
jgi:TusA-related sulfurtransferase